jgi:two-component system cell cycle sensor histidine kinase/response regulator CckA
MNETKGTILVVEDEELVLDLEVTLLQRIGYNTLMARNSREACQLFKDRKEQIDLVILDMIMPDENGATTYKCLKSINPDVKVLISTGYFKDSKVQEILNDSQNELIMKPFKLEEFTKKIDTILSLN